VTMQFIRCSAWFGSVRLVLIPENFMRACLFGFKKLKLINLRVRFQPFEDFRLSLNGALFPNSQTLIINSQIRILIPIPREPLQFCFGLRPPPRLSLPRSPNGAPNLERGPKMGIPIITYKQKHQFGPPFSIIKYRFRLFCRTFKLSCDRGWRGVCCSEHNP